MPGSTAGIQHHRFQAQGAKDLMTKAGKRYLLGNRGKGYLQTSGMQARFIIFLIFLLIAYSVLLRIFQKLAEIVQLPLFLPITLLTLLVFIGIAGIIYSHTFVGPINRIRRALEQLASGESDVSLRLREADDPTLKDLVRTIGQLCENSRSSRDLIQEVAEDLFKDIAALQESINRGAEKAEIQKHLEVLRRDQELLDKTIKSFGRM
jgi:methyl-accepting chemotaxis protein